MDANGSQEGNGSQGVSDGGAVGDGSVDPNANGTQSGQTGEGSTDPNAQAKDETNIDGAKHEESVPYERFKEVNDKVAQFNQLIESAKTDPAAKEQLMEMFGLKAEQPAQTSETSVTPFQKFLTESVPQEHRPHYDAFARSISQELEGYIEEKMAPIMAWIGKSRLGEVEKANPDFQKYQGQVAELMKKHGSLDPEEALAIAAYKDRVKSASRAGQVKEQARQGSLQKTPVTKTPGLPGSTQPKGPVSIRGMIQHAWDKNAQPA